MSKADSNRLMIFERKIHGEVNYEGRWRIQSNNEIEQILENENIEKFIKSGRIRELVHVERMYEERIPKRITSMLVRTEGTRRKGRLRSKWIYEVKKDLKQMGIRNWRSIAKDRNERRRIVLEAKGHYGL